MRHQPELPDENSTIDELLNARPGAAIALLRHGMACVGCAMARFETLADAAREYRVTPASLLKELGADAEPSRPRRPDAARPIDAAGHRTRRDQRGREARP